MSERPVGDGERLDRALETIEQSKRDTLRKLVGAAAWVAPVVVSFAIDGMTVGAAHAYHNNSSHS